MEQELLLECQRSDRNAQRKVYEKMAGRLYAVCRRYLKNDEDIEDLDYLNSYEGRLARLVQRCEAIMTSEAFDYVALFSSTNVTTQSTQPPPSESP